MNQALSNFLSAVHRTVGDSLSSEISEPYDPSGVWFVDLALDTYKLIVQYSPRLGFGLSTEASDFGDAPDERFESEHAAAQRAVQLLTTKGQTIPPTTLFGLRGSQTQSQVASSMSIKQPSYARMEHAQLCSFEVKTLARAVKAMHATLLLVVQSEDGKFFVLQDSQENMKGSSACASEADHFRFSGSAVGLVALPSVGVQHIDASDNVVVGNFGAESPAKRRPRVKPALDQARE
ncbi:hypothetical protein [Piscinibacter gummiphilus]|uniref:hypothetical protein n=1 Tax=Piscinibacter gummiphilus TaxID=946333 RepID=UPI0012F4DF8D|nr:hypothetical protein [Piscinibacter gummiphilus]